MIVTFADKLCADGITAEKTHDEDIPADGRRGIEFVEGFSEDFAGVGGKSYFGEEFGKEEEREHRRQNGSHVQRKPVFYRLKVDVGKNDEDSHQKADGQNDKSSDGENFFAFHRTSYERRKENMSEEKFFVFRV